MLEHLRKKALSDPDKQPPEIDVDLVLLKSASSGLLRRKRKGEEDGGVSFTRTNTHTHTNTHTQQIFWCVSPCDFVGCELAQALCHACVYMCMMFKVKNKLKPFKPDLLRRYEDHPVHPVGYLMYVFVYII